MRTFWGLKKIKKLRQEAIQSQSKIRELFVNHTVPPGGGDDIGWGQFFNINGAKRQRGIYGTSAGAQVLTFYNSDIDRQYREKACEFICTALKEDDNRFRQKGDVTDVYKIAYIVAACPPTLEQLEQITPQMEELAKRQLENEGWGEYYSDAEKDPVSKILPTSFALLSLKRYSHFANSNAARRAISWLSKQVLEHHNITIYEIAMTVITLQEYRSFEDNLEEFEEAVKYCRGRLLTWIKKRNPYFFGAKSFYAYSIDSNGISGNRYIFLLTDCLVALAFLRLKQFSTERKYILNVVNFFVREILDKNGFAPDEQQISTVDHLWIFKLLSEFKKVNLKKIIPPAPYVIASYPVPLKLAVAALLFIFASLVAYFDFTAEQEGWKFIRGVWILLGGLGVSLTAEIIAHIGLDKE